MNAVRDLTLRSDSVAATEAYGAALGCALREHDVVVLEGALGAGKTCLVRGMVAGAGGDPAAVRSPTFVLHQPHRCAAITLHHIDLYRLGPDAPIEVLDLDTLLEDGAAVIEWGGYADLRDHRPSTVSVDGDPAGSDHRVLHLRSPAAAHIAEAWRAMAARSAR